MSTPVYRLTPFGSIERLSDGAVIPTDPANPDYRDFLVWCEEGNVPAPADLPSS